MVNFYVYVEDTILSNRITSTYLKDNLTGPLKVFQERYQVNCSLIWMRLLFIYD